MAARKSHRSLAHQYIERVRKLGLSDGANKVLDAIEETFPPHELLAVASWLNTFYRFQLEWLLDFGRFSLISKARQIGASHTVAAMLVLWAMLGESTTVISIGEREAEEVITKAENHALVLATLGSEWAIPRQHGEQVDIATGATIRALPTSSGGRSYTGNVFLDEIGYYKDPDSVWDAASGSTLHGYRLRVASTPNGVGNLWHGLWTDPTQHAGYRLHETTIDDAIRDGMRVDIAECWKMARGDSRVFDQLFRCKFLDNDSQYIPSEFLTAAERAYGDNPLPGAAGIVDLTSCREEGLEFYGGLDIGLKRDRTVLVIIAVCRATGEWWVVHIESHKRTDQQLIEELVAKAFNFFHCRRFCADATGIGSIPAQSLGKKWGIRFEGVPFSAPVKEDLATGMYESMSNGLARLPKVFDYNGQREAALLRDDMCAIRRTVTRAGNVRYDAPQTKSGHADRAWALMLARSAGSVPLPARGTGQTPLTGFG